MQFSLVINTLINLFGCCFLNYDEQIGVIDLYVADMYWLRTVSKMKQTYHHSTERKQKKYY